MPLNRTADLSRIVRTAETLRQELRREPTPEEIAAATGLSLDVVQSLAALNTAEVRLDAPLDPEGDRSLIERFIADEQADAEEQAMDRFLTEEIEQALRTLPPRDAKVLRLYFGLDGGREHTLEEIGGMLGVTRERVRQLRDRALKRLREGDVGRALASFARAKRCLSLLVHLPRLRRSLPSVTPPVACPRLRPGRFVAHVGRRGLETARALADVRTWAPAAAGTDAAARAWTRSPSRCSSPSSPASSSPSSPPTSSPAPCRSTSSGALVGKTIMMELGPVLTGMALAGRVGANIAAELGTMKVTEQVDALETLAYDPQRLSGGAPGARRRR